MFAWMNIFITLKLIKREIRLEDLQRLNIF